MAIVLIPRIGITGILGEEPAVPVRVTTQADLAESYRGAIHSLTSTADDVRCDEEALVRPTRQGAWVNLWVHVPERILGSHRCLSCGWHGVPLETLRGGDGDDEEEEEYPPAVCPQCAGVAEGLPGDEVAIRSPVEAQP